VRMVVSRGQLCEMQLTCIVAGNNCALKKA
jgi:hypothetical protein